MAQHWVSVSALIPAPAHRVYTIISDYRNEHPKILPKPPFVSLTVEQGGIGADTQIAFQMRLMGQVQSYRAAISEPEPGHVLVETVIGQPIITTFTVEPREQGQQSFVTISTETHIRDGLLGSIDAWLTTRMLKPIYEQELVQLAHVATTP